MPPDTPKHINDDFIPEDVENAYSRMINSLFSWRKKAKATPTTPCRLPLTPAAKALFNEYHDELEDERATLPSGIMKATLSKLKGCIMRVALMLHVVHIASNYPDGKVPQGIPPIGEVAMRAAIILTKWYRREDQRILQMVCPNEVLVGDKEVAKILEHIQRRDNRTTTARFVAQNIRAFDGVGGSGQASKKLEEMVTNGLLIHDDQPLKKRVYSLSNAAYADQNSETDNSVGVCRQIVGSCVGSESDAKLCWNKDLEKVVGVVGGFGECEPEEDEWVDDGEVPY